MLGMLPNTIDAGVAALLGAGVGAGAAIITQLLAQICSAVRDANLRRRRESRVAAIFDGYLAALEPYLDVTGLQKGLIEQRLDQLRDAASDPEFLIGIGPQSIHEILQTIAKTELAVSLSQQELERYSDGAFGRQPGVENMAMAQTLATNTKAAFDLPLGHLRSARSMIKSGT
jgi:hypothetical protein